MQANGTVNITHNGTTGYGFGNSPTEWKRYQCFVAPPHCTKTVDIGVKLRQVKGDEYFLPVAELFAASNGKPTGPALATGFLSPLSSDDFEVIWGALPATGLVPGNQYAVVITAPNIPNENVRLEWAVAPVYSHLGFGKWNGFSWIDESNLGNGWLEIGVCEGDSAIDITHNGSAGQAFGRFYDAEFRYQTFIATGNRAITGVDLKLRKDPTGSPSPVTVALYETNNHAPTGPPLASAVIDSNCVGAGWTVIHAPLYYRTLVFEREYAIVLGQRTRGVHEYEWAVGQANKATSFGKWDGFSWIDQTSRGDGWLKIWLAPQNCDFTIEVLHTANTGYGFGNTADEIKRYQTFSLDRKGTVTGVDLKLRKYNGSTQGELSVEIYPVTGDVPSGRSLASAILPPLQIRDEWCVVHVPIKSNALEPGSYAVVLTQKPLGAARYEWAVGRATGAAFGKWTGTWVNESTLGDGWMKIWISPPDTGVGISKITTNGCGFGSSFDEIKRFQTFVAPIKDNCASYDLNGVQLQLRKLNGTDQTDVLVQLYETSGNQPTGFPKATAIISSGYLKNEWSIIAAPLYHKYWDGGGLEPGGTYAIVLSQRTPGVARYEWAVGRGNRIGGFGKWTGSAWVNESSLGKGWLKVSLIPHPPLM